MKNIVAKFIKLKYLCLNLTFSWILHNSGKLLVRLAPFKALKYLNLQIDSSASFNYSDAVKFIVAHQNLEILKFRFKTIFNTEYAELFEGIQTMKSLKDLQICQTSNSLTHFSYCFAFKTLKALKKLQSFKLDLRSKYFNGKDMKAIFRYFLKHPSLDKVNLSLTQDHNSYLPPECFDNELYADVTKLTEKLRSLKLLLRLGTQPDYCRVNENFSKIIMPSGIPTKNFAYSQE